MQVRCSCKGCKIDYASVHQTVWVLHQDSKIIKISLSRWCKKVLLNGKILCISEYLLQLLFCTNIVKTYKQKIRNHFWYCEPDESVWFNEERLDSFLWTIDQAKLVLLRDSRVMRGLNSPPPNCLGFVGHQENIPQNQLLCTQMHHIISCSPSHHHLLGHCDSVQWYMCVWFHRRHTLSDLMCEAVQVAATLVGFTIINGSWIMDKNPSLWSGCVIQRNSKRWKYFHICWRPKDTMCEHRFVAVMFCP